MKKFLARVCRLSWKRISFNNQIFCTSIDNKKLKSGLDVVFGRHLLSFEDMTKNETVLNPRLLAW